MIWLVVSVIAVASAVTIVSPFLRRRVMDVSGGDATMSIYADQIDEVHRDRAQGLIGQGEAHAAVREIERRQAQFARALPSGLHVSQRNLGAAIGVAALVFAAAFGGYAWKGDATAMDMPLGARNQEILEQRAAAGDINSRIKLLIQQTEDDPKDFENWWVLAKSYAAIGDNAASAEAYRQAVLLNETPGVLSAYAEALTLANGNKVPEGAEIIFAQVVREANDPRAAYYLALARAQRQDFEGALADWVALFQASDPTAPWMQLIRRDIGNMVRFLDLKLTDFLPDATEMEIARASGTAPQSHVDRTALRAHLAEDPMDHAAWITLAEAEALAGDAAAATTALRDARQHFRAAPFVLDKLAEAERALGLDLVAGSVRGPDAEDIAAAATLSEADRANMIEGMVAGLAARLDENPNDPDGWVMLIRSYRTMGHETKANEALETVTDLLQGRPELSAILNAI